MIYIKLLVFITNFEVLMSIENNLIVSYIIGRYVLTKTRCWHCLKLLLVKYDEYSMLTRPGDTL